MTVPKDRRITPADLIRAKQQAIAERDAKRKAELKRSKLWAQERAKHAIPRTDPAFHFVQKRLQKDYDDGYKLREPWCFKGRLEIHLRAFYELTDEARARNSVVYYVRVGPYIKIGTTIRLNQRMNNYPPGSKLLITEPGDHNLEYMRHQQFADSLAERKEWFSPTPELKEHIKNLQVADARQRRGSSQSA